MSEAAQGIQLPIDGSGKITGAFLVPGKSSTAATVGDGSDVWLPASVIVDARGVEIGSEILSALQGIAGTLERIEELQALSTEALTN